MLPTFVRVGNPAGKIVDPAGKFFRVGKPDIQKVDPTGNFWGLEILLAK